MRVFTILGLFTVFTIHASAYPASVDRSIKIAASPLGCTPEGSYFDLSAIYTFFSGKSPVYIYLTITNHRDTECNPGNWFPALNCDRLVRWSVKPGSSLDQFTDEDLEKEEILFRGSFFALGSIIQEKDQAGGIIGRSLKKNGVFLERIHPHTTKEFLLQLIPEQPFPEGDFNLSLSLTIADNEYRLCMRFRVRVFTNNPDDRAKLYQQQSEVAKYLVSPVEERRLLEEAVQKVPESPWSWYNLGNYYRSKRNYEQELKVFSEAVHRFPQLRPQKKECEPPGDETTGWKKAGEHYTQRIWDFEERARWAGINLERQKKGMLGPVKK